MPYATNQTLIFLPVLVVVALTLVGFVRMATGRAAAVKAGHDPAFYRAHIGTPEPEHAAAGVRHWDNLFEVPTLFYAGCLAAFVLGGVTGWALAFAWGFAVARVVQSLVHITYNNPGQRGLAFVLGVLFVFALWINIALKVFAGL
ncbi:MAPEG family protein [Novosphingobium sp. 9U]|uniref:MAPEG family protein n=1 Tax=Novosphingobium sp. 9U TaxID=2653158 RepID=UPI0012F206D8|nr:MAPEG family protein [Novosphingobium sp. 9U]VWX53104.1 conserved membrane hypothetical protein [Novosphingobium sp. 9U]